MMNILYHHLGIKLETPLMVGVSGGPDSVALLHLLYEAGFKNLIVAHLDHQIRSNSNRDAQFVRKLAKKYGYGFELRRRDIKRLAKKKKENIEAVGRDERYGFFRDVKKKYKARFIVTAHQADDQVETVLLNIVRGCGLEGLSVMKEVDGDLWRPLLLYSKEDIKKYGQEKKLRCIDDRSNEELQYRRNFLRKKVIPQLKKLNPNFLRTMQSNIHLWHQAAEYLETQARSFLEQHRLQSRRYNLKAFLDLAPLEQQGVLRSLFEEIHGHKKNLSAHHLNQVLHVLRTNISGKQKEFGDGKVLVRARDFFEVKPDRTSRHCP